MQNYYDARDGGEFPTHAIRLEFERGTLVVDGVDETTSMGPCVWDGRMRRWRAAAHHYRTVLGHCLKLGPVVDAARQYAVLEGAQERSGKALFRHQAEALDAWERSGRRGVVVLPTGSGKSHVAVKAIESVGRSALIVAPTLDLVEQWVRMLGATFGMHIGTVGGGSHEVCELTVTTYDSAAIHMDHLGKRFGLLVFDEVHHLPATGYRWAAEASIAPYRLGLSATPERPDGAHRVLDDLVGPEVYRRSARELQGDVLAPYRTQIVEVPMDPEDQRAYDEARQTYRDFVRDAGVRLGGRNGWHNFLRAASRSARGREAFKAQRTSKHLALAHRQKLDMVAELLSKHASDRSIVFANDNASVYEISERLLCPALTHQTPLKERAEILQKFADGTYRALVTSRVLNEGVDVPEASVAIVLSGTGSVREHVQRLGRILRRSPEKEAILYEIVTPETVEVHVSARRRSHDAYE